MNYQKEYEKERENIFNKYNNKKIKYWWYNIKCKRLKKKIEKEEKLCYQDIQKTM